jgi:hypothetical protein
MDTSDKSAAASRYSKLEMDREPFLRRARESSKLTLTSIAPPLSTTGDSDLYKPYQSLGARGAKNLAAKLLMTLFPPNTPFHRYVVNVIELANEMEANPELKTQLDEAMAKTEKIIQDHIETTGIRRAAFLALKHLVISGNILVYAPRKGGLRAYRLSQYVVQRDHEGNLKEILLKETLSPLALPQDVQEFLKANCASEGDNDIEKDVDLYTWIKFNGKTWNIHQEVKGFQLPESIAEYPKDELPWNALRMGELQGENYGRGFVEDLIGDLQSLEGLSQAIVEGAAAGAKVVFLVDPSGTTSVQKLAKTPNGGFCPGREEEVKALQLQKFNDFQVAKQQIDSITGRLEASFLLNSSVQRNGERVTAEEIRFMAAELESSLGGEYASLSQEFQLWLVKCITKNLQKDSKFPKIPKSVTPLIVTGLEALGRNNDLQKLDDLVSDLGQKFGPEVVAKYLSVSEYITRRTTALMIDKKNLVRSEQEVQQADAQAQQQQAMQSAAPNLIKAGSDILNTNTKVSAQQAAPAA